MELFENVELFNKPIIKDNKYLSSNHKIFQKYSSLVYQKYTFELLETLCKKSDFENKSLILHKSIYFLLKFIYESKNDILISNYDIIILVSFYLGTKIVENQKKIPNLTKLKNIYKEKFGEYKNEEIKNAEIIYIKLLEYNINFMTAYDYLCYLFRNNKQFIDLPKNNLEIYIKENTQNFCNKKPITIIEECINNVEKNKVLSCPMVIKKKIVHQQKTLCLDIGNNKDESLSTSISSGYFNYNEINKNEKSSPLKNILSKYIDFSLERLTEGNYYNNKNYFTSNAKYQNNITINNCNIDSNNFTYSKKNVKKINNSKNLKYFTKKKYKNNLQRLIYKTNIKEKMFQRNDNPLNSLNLNYTNNYNSNNSPKKLYTKPYIKKEESKGCFTSNKKKDKEIKFNFYKRQIKKNNTNSNNVDEKFKCSLKKKLLFDDIDECFDLTTE